MKSLLIIISTTILLAACGNTHTDPTSVTLKAGDCNAIESGNTLDKLQEGTVVEITHELNGSRSVCVSSGKALLTFTHKK